MIVQKMKKVYLFPLLILCLIYGCSDLEDDFSTNPNHSLAFSADTLAFDTVFSTIGSTTKKLMVYNKNKEALNIESIMLSGKGETGFRINVDGRKGREFSNIGIMGKDSMYVFVEVTVNPQDRNNPFEIKDSVEFIVNGIKTSVLLQAYGQDVHLIKGGMVLENDTTWTGERPFLVYDSIVISPQATLKLEAGTTLYMHNDAKVSIYGTIEAYGTVENPVLFRGDRLDDLLPGKLAYDQISGQWGGLKFYPESYNNLFEHVIIRNGKNGIVCLPSTTEKPKITFRNSQITNMTANLLFAESCHIEASNTEFTNAEDSLIALSGGKHRFIHCTIVNNMGGIKSRTGQSAVTIQHNKPNTGKQAYPVEYAYFKNCIIDGKLSQKTGEIKIVSSEDFDFRFLNCYLKQEDTLKNTTDCLFGGSLKYQQNGSEEVRYVYDFRLSNDKEGVSAAIGKANMETARLYPQDRYGVTRISESILPDIGAYQYVPEPEKED